MIICVQTVAENLEWRLLIKKTLAEVIYPSLLGKSAMTELGLMKLPLCKTLSTGVDSIMTTSIGVYDD